MFCGNCGKHLPNGAGFCSYCGAKADSGDTSGSPDSHFTYRDSKIHGHQKKMNHKKRPKSILPVLAAVFCLLLVFAGAYATIGLNMQKNRLVSEIEASEIPEYLAGMEMALSDWEQLNIADVFEKKEVLDDLKSIYQDVKDFEQCAEDLEKLQNEKEKFHMEDSSYGNYVKILEECAQAVQEKRAGDAVSLLESANAALEQLITANDAYIHDLLALYETADLSTADASEIDTYQQHLSKVKELSGKGDKDYQEIKQEISRIEETIYMYIQPKNLLNINVQQIDVTEFPKVKLYLSIKDALSGVVPENLSDSLFYIKKENANSQYVKQLISNVNQLNEAEALKIDMVADVSGSMDGMPLIEAKNIMCNFINSVQFSAGDMVELTSFATGVRLEQQFCGDAGLLINKISNLYTGDMTSLYDALYTSVERVAAQSGAKCVIAFTDGNDNYSSCTKEDVIGVAQRYHVPVFIIGIGSGDYYDVSYIAQQTGGAYYGVNDVFSMESIYSEIYRMEKELFLIEFEDSTGLAVTDVSNIETGYHSIEYGGECKYTYTPNILLSANGSGIYQDGPESIVENYLKNFDAAVTNSDFSRISQYLKPGSAIYNEQQQYIMRNISEQLNSFEIISVEHSNQQNCVVRTRETYYVQVGNEPLQLMTQECAYALEESGGEWKMTAFADQVNVISRIRQ